MGRLADTSSPYLRSHDDQPVDWWPWGEEAFAEARRRDLPLLISIGYATCHWCHVMARESFSDPATAQAINSRFVPVKVDREEHPDVDAAYLAAASAFTPSLGWPLTVFATPDGGTFFAGTYFPPQPAPGVPGFGQVLDAVAEAWTERRDEADAAAAQVREALAAVPRPGGDGLPDAEQLDGAVDRIAGFEDREHGGFGGAPKFPMAPVLTFLLDRGTADSTALAERTLRAMAASGLRDPVEGGFFRYAVRRDWTEPHYERMLVDNAQLLLQYARIGDAATADGVAGFLLDVLRVPGGFASGQDSESDVDGVRTEGGYYALDAAARAAQPPPALDRKVLTGLTGLAIGALAESGVLLDRPAWVAAAREAAAELLKLHGARPPVARASLDGRVSSAPATLEDHASLAGGLLRVALAAGDPSLAVVARDLVEACAEVAAPGGPDPSLAARGLALPPEPTDGPGPSGPAALADAAWLLAALTGEDAHREVAERALAAAGPLLDEPSGHGSALAAAARMVAPLDQLVLVADDDDPTAEGLRAAARGWFRPGRVFARVSPATAGEFAAAGFELFAGRAPTRARA